MTIRTLTILWMSLATMALAGLPTASNNANNGVNGQVQLYNNMDPNLYQNHYNSLTNPATANFYTNGFNNAYSNGYSNAYPNYPTTNPAGYDAYGNPTFSNTQMGAYTNTMTSGNAGGLKDILAIFNAQEGSFGQRVFKTAAEIYFKPMANSMLNGMLHRLPQLAGFSTNTGQPMVGMPPQCDPYFMYRMQMQQNQQRILGATR